MSKISDKLNIINDAKNDIKTAIENKGVSVGNVGIQEYASKIDEMEVTTPITKGIIVNECDISGYPIDVSVVSMTSIPTYYFYYACYNNAWLSKIGGNLHLPSNLMTINDYAFYRCTNLKLTSLPNSVTSIGMYAFQYCTSFSPSSLPDSLTTIGNYGFANCTALALTSLPDSLTTIGNYAFDGCQNLKLESLPGGLTRINDRVFRQCTKLNLLELPESLISIGQYAFDRCTNLKLTSLPNSVTTIENYAFTGCTNLALTSLPESLTSIGQNAFYSCYFLEISVIPNSVTSIGNNAFQYCTTKLTHLDVLSESITLGNYVFASCNYLTQIIFRATTPPKLGSNVFQYTPIASKTGYIYVPDESIETYQTATNWSTYASQIKGISELEG